MRRRTGVAATGAAFALVCAGAGVAVGAHQAQSSTPKLTVTMGKGTFKVSGPKTFAAGRVSVKATATDAERSIQFAHLHAGYTLKDFRTDIATFNAGANSQSGPSKSDLKHLRHAIANVDLYGGLDVAAGQTEQASVVLPTAGTYLAYIDHNGIAKTPVKLHVTAPAGSRPTPNSSATVTMLTKRRFGGSKVLPAKGTITVANKSTESPHFLFMVHVKNGTTKKQIEQGLQSPNGPTFIRKGQAGTDTIGKGEKMTLSYKLPKGEYAELCFFPDPKTGMPHAFMGMIGIVHLK